MKIYVGAVCDRPRANTVRPYDDIKENLHTKATGIARRLDDLGRVVIPKEIRRVLRIREGDPLQITLTQEDLFCRAMLWLSERVGLGR